MFLFLICPKYVELWEKIRKKSRKRLHIDWYTFILTLVNFLKDGGGDNG